MAIFSHTSDKGTPITGICQMRADIRRHVREYMRVAPNADLGDASDRENMRSAFFLIRNFNGKFGYIQAALGELQILSYKLEDC